MNHWMQAALLRVVWPTGLALSLVTLPTASFAQSPSEPAAQVTDADKTAARSLFFEGRDALEAEDYGTAVDRFKRSYALYAAPTTGLGLARSQVGAGMLVGAYETYSRVINEPFNESSDAFREARATAEQERKGLQPRLPSVVIEIVGPSAPSVALDGVALDVAALGVKRFVDPGRHTIVVEAQDYKSTTKELSVAEGESRTVRIEPTYAPEPALVPGTDASAPAKVDAPKSPLSLAGITLTAVGVTGLIVGGVTGALYLGEKNTVDDSCTESDDGSFACTEQAAVDAASAGHTLGVANAIALGVGVAATAVGVTILIADGGDPETTAIKLHVSPAISHVEVVF